MVRQTLTNHRPQSARIARTPAHRRPRLGLRTLAIIIAVATAGFACQAAPSTAIEPRPVLHIMAASSLREAFTDLGARFEARHPNVDLALSFAGSHILALQIERGAPLDVVATASAAHLKRLQHSKITGEPLAFAHNILVVITPETPRSPVRGFDGLPRANRLVLGVPDVPVGQYAREALKRRGPEFAAQVLATLVSEESNTRLVRAKVLLGEADAAIVYRSDALGIEGLRTHAIPPNAAVPVTLWMARATKPVTAPDADLAQAWMDLVLSAEGQAILKARGFETLTP